MSYWGVGRRFLVIEDMNLDADLSELSSVWVRVGGISGDPRQVSEATGGLQNGGGVSPELSVGQNVP
jgi:hypothetical protein